MDQRAVPDWGGSGASLKMPRLRLRRWAQNGALGALAKGAWPVNGLKLWPHDIRMTVWAFKCSVSPTSALLEGRMPFAGAGEHSGAFLGLGATPRLALGKRLGSGHC